MIRRKIRTVCAFMMSVSLLISGFPSRAAEPDYLGTNQAGLWMDNDEGDGLIRNGARDIIVHFGAEAMPADNEAGWEAEVRRRCAETLMRGERSVSLKDLQLSYTQNKKAVYAAMRDVLNTNPQYFYVSGTLGMSYGGDLITAVNYNYDLEFCVSENVLNQGLVSGMRAQYDARMAEALACVDEGMTDVEKALAFHDWLVRECDYDHANLEAGTVPSISHTAAGAFINGVCVCDGYSQAMSALLQKVGIDSYVVSSEAMNHAWNIVKLGENYYHIDVTWDDPVFTSNEEYQDAINEGFVRHNYFVLSDQEITANRHNGWDGGGIQCLDEGSYEGYAFRTCSRTAYTFGNGWWYYKDGQMLYRTKDLASNAVQSRRAENIVISAFYYGGGLYYATGKGVMRITDLDNTDFSKGNEEEIYSIEKEYPGYTIYEFAIKNDQLIVNSYNGSNDWKAEKIPLNTRPAPTEPPVTPTEPPVSTETPVTPTEPPVPTESPVIPTEAPVVPTPPPSGDQGGNGLNGIHLSQDGNWYYYTNGQVNWDFNGLYYDSIYGWWLIQNGLVAFDYTGLWNDTNYGWWLVQNGTVAFDYTGLWNDANYGWWLIGNGTVAFDYNGLWNDPNFGQWYIQNGTIDFGYHTAA